MSDIHITYTDDGVVELPAGPEPAVYADPYYGEARKQYAKTPWEFEIIDGDHLRIDEQPFEVEETEE